LHRAPDDSGLGFWASAAAGGVQNRINVLNGFEASGEFQTLVSTLYGTASNDNQRTEHFVDNFYLAALARHATSTELQQQRDRLNNAAAIGYANVQGEAETMGRELLASQVTNFSIGESQFVTNLYEAFMQRGPDAGGLGFWTSQAGINNAAQRQNVLNAFATCGPARDLSGTLYREVFWLVSDQLGTPRIVVNKSGSLASVKRHDYLPFGEEIGSAQVGLIGGRDTTLGYLADSVRQKFTAYEADGETGLNFAQARYQSTVQGRFTSVDPVGASANVGDPQSFNRYSYVENMPTNFTDPSGTMMNDASMGYADVAGIWMGGGDPSFGGFENGRSIIAARDTERTAMIQARIDGKLAQSYLDAGNIRAANDIFKNNSNVGRLENGKELWGTDATVQESSSKRVEGPFVLRKGAEKADKLNGTRSKTKACALWVQQMAAEEGINLGPADNWIGGEQVLTNDVAPGTVAISGLNENGEYPNADKYNHTVLILDKFPGGFNVLENVNGHIQKRAVTGNGDYFRGADQYFVLKIVVTYRGGLGTNAPNTTRP